MRKALIFVNILAVLAVVYCFHWGVSIPYFFKIGCAVNEFRGCLESADRFALSLLWSFLTVLILGAVYGAASSISYEMDVKDEEEEREIQEAEDEKVRLEQKAAFEEEKARQERELRENMNPVPKKRKKRVR